MNNNILEVDFTRALPDPLKNDENMLALGKTIAGELQKNIEMSRLAVIYPRIDELSEAVLDILAHDLHIDWYDPDAPIELKREIIKDSVNIHRTLGTARAVERVVKAYFGSGQVRHWYEFGGKPHHFRIISDNPSVSAEREKEFLRILDVVKRKSSWLEKVLVTLVTEFQTYYGVAFREFNREAHLMGTRDSLSAYFGVLLRDVGRETHTMRGVDPDPIYKVFAAVRREFTREKHAIGSGNINASFGTLLHERTHEKHIFKEV